MKLTSVFEEDGEVVIAQNEDQLYALENHSDPKKWRKIDAYAVLYDANGVGKLTFETPCTPC